MNNPNDGGPAFPSGKSESPGYENSLPYFQGMTLRDYFAAAALTGCLANPECNGSNNQLVKDCYTVADCMLAARDRKGEA